MKILQEARNTRKKARNTIKLENCANIILFPSCKQLMATQPLLKKLLISECNVLDLSRLGT